MASTSSPSTPTSSSRSWKYQVFLSFRGGDTRRNFVDHLFSALEKSLIKVYKDDVTLPRGETIRPSLFKAIEESQIAVVVFSKNYADSSWCLDELSHIMKCKDESGLIVMPIFYDVEPTDVRKLKGEFGEAFAKQEANNINKAVSWRKALFDASEIAGWEPKNFADGHESKLIEEIVDEVLKILFSSSSDVDEGLIGMGDRVDDLVSRLEIGSDGVRMVGIWGVGGGGKTTLAESVYSAISRQFQGHCFVENIREESNKESLKELQQKMLSNVFKRTIVVPSVTEGKRMLKSRLCRSNVLVVLDDVNKLDQLEALAGSRDWFGSGSRIIITTRDEHLLRTHKVDHVSPVILLSHFEAVSLFNKHAYNENIRINDYGMLSSLAVSYAAGLPLALKVVGSFLYDKNNDEWISYLDKLKSIPNVDVMVILMISFEGLEDYLKELFLDIACFFRGDSKEDVMEILDAFGFHPVIGIKVLKQKALIAIVNGKFDMHDLIQEMGHHIVRGKDPYNAERHSRVWKQDEIRNMCFEDATMDNDKIEAIKCYWASPRLIKFVSTMKKLRWLSANCSVNGNFKGPDFLPNELRCIELKNYPAESFPDSFRATKLVILKLDGCKQKRLWNDTNRLLPNLKVLILVKMKKLLNTPNFDHLPRLQKLTLDECHGLIEIHPSLGNHRKLEYIRVEACWELRMFPAIEQTRTLKTLIVKSCHKMEFGGFQRKMVRLESDEKMSLQLTEKVFTQLPHSLRELDLSYCYSEDGKILYDIGDFSDLRKLNLEGNNFSRIPFSVSQLTQLKILILSSCRNLEVYPELPSSLAVFIAKHCPGLKFIGDSVTNCKWLSVIKIVRGSILTDGGRLLESMLQGKDIENRCMRLELKGLEIPKSIVPPICSGDRCTLQLPENWFNYYCGFLMCTVLNVSKGYSMSISMTQVTDSSIAFPCARSAMGTGMDYQDDAVWEESDDDTTTLVTQVTDSSIAFPCARSAMGTGMDYQDDAVWEESDDDTTTLVTQVTDSSIAFPCARSAISAGMDYQDDAVWEESDDDTTTLVTYVPFGSLRHASWWDVTYKQVSFEIYLAPTDQVPICHGFGEMFIPRKTFPVCNGFGVMLIPRKTENSPTVPSTDSSKFSDDDYTPKIVIQRDSKRALVYDIFCTR